MKNRDIIWIILLIVLIDVAIFTNAFWLLGIAVLALIIKIGLKINNISKKVSELVASIYTGICLEIVFIVEIINFDEASIVCLIMWNILVIFDIITIGRQPKKIISYIKIIVDIVALNLNICWIFSMTSPITDIGLESINMREDKLIFIFITAPRTILNVIELIVQMIREKKHMCNKCN